MKPILEIANLRKRFGTLEALHDVDVQIYPNEVVGLAGLSGSGKSALAKVLAGLYEPTAGTISFQGQRLRYPFSPHIYGIEVIHQYPVLVEGLDVTSNIFLGCELFVPFIGRLLRIPDQPRMDRIAADTLAELGIVFDSLIQNVGNLSSEHRQLIAIARATVRPAELIFIDEPTVLLSFAQQQKLLSLVQFWQKQGKTIIFSSTNLEHLFAVTDRILVMREGCITGCYRTDESTREAVVAEMVGQVRQERLTPVIWALDSYYRARDKADHLYQQTNILQQDLVVQDTINQQLLLQLTRQVKALDQANTALQDAQRRLLTEREEERKHLARELHDDVLQDLLSTNYELEAMFIQAEGQEKLQQPIRDVRNSIRQMIDSIRNICGDLRPPTIDSLGVRAAIQSHTREWSHRTHIDIDLNMEVTLERLPEALELSIFRIIQESLSNIHRHSGASHVSIELLHTSPRTLMISIADNGKGLPDNFDLSKLAGHGHYGLIGISERVALLSGHLRLQNRVEGGLLIQVEIPHPRIQTAQQIQVLS